MTAAQYTKRYILFIIGLYFSALGIAFTKQADLGMSTISSVPYVVSFKLDFISFGMWSAIWNIMMTAAQVVILRKNFKPVQLLQIPFSFVFGWFTDFSVWLVSPIPAENYAVKLLLVFTGIAVLGFGIALAVIADVMYNSGEGLVKAISDVTRKKFGSVKIVFDISCVAFAAALSMLFFGEIKGIREGTLLSAFLIGVVVNILTKALSKSVNRLLK